MFGHLGDCREASVDRKLCHLGAACADVDRHHRRLAGVQNAAEECGGACLARLVFVGLVDLLGRMRRDLWPAGYLLLHDVAEMSYVGPMDRIYLQIHLIFTFSNIFFGLNKEHFSEAYTTFNGGQYFYNRKETFLFHLREKCQIIDFSNISNLTFLTILSWTFFHSVVISIMKKKKMFLMQS